MTLINSKSFIFFILIFSCGLFACQKENQPKESIPLPEHPRPDFQRTDWINLNGYWEFEFDGSDQGVMESWFNGQKAFTQKILVPFPWGSPLSEVEDKDDIAWYKRQITVPE